MVLVVETWTLREEFVHRALDLMQEMDEIVGPGAHGDPGWCEHGRFFQDQDDPATIHMSYRWRSRPEHELFIKQEELILGDFYRGYCTGSRTIRYFNELPVDVEADGVATATH